MRFHNVTAAGGLPALILAGVLTAGCAGSGPQKTGAEPLPSDPNALVLGAEVALQRGRYREAAEAYVRAAQLAEDEALAEQAARVAYEHHQWTQVAAAADRWLGLNHTSEEARRFAAFAALRLYRIDAAAQHIDALLNTAFINPQSGFLALLSQLDDSGSEAATTAVLQALIPKYDNLTEAHYALAQAALQSENFALALRHAERARELGQYWAPAGLLLARLQMLHGQTEEALATARSVLDQEDQASYRLEYGLLLLQAGQEEAGRAELDEVANSDEKVASVAERALADIEFQMGDHDSAARRYRNLLSSGWFVYDSLFYLGAIAELREQWPEALQSYSRVNGGEMVMAAQVRAARIMVEQQGLEAGLKHLEEFAAARPQYTIEALAARANLLAAAGDRDGALALLDTAIDEYPDAIDLRYARVFQLEADDRVDDAVDELRAMYAERPADPVVLNALGYTLVDRTRHHREGFELIEAALEQTPDSGAVLDSMGWAKHRLGQHEEALQYLERARARITDPEVELHIGEVLLALGRRDEAKQVLQAAALRYPDNEKLRQRMREAAPR
ncbi:MAG: hypothetical protein DIU71_07980 [Proteobacteria bacterium]|nr:MAG: hypothetical protein DIU71_07980 [Pseudomonadota bacterium]